MPLLTRTVPTPLVVEIGEDAVACLDRILSDGRISSGGKVAIAVGPGIGLEIADRVRDSIPSGVVHILEGGTVEGARALVQQLRGSFLDAIVGIGGGRTLDAAKYGSTILGLPFVSVATTLTHDGLASPVAILDTAGGRRSFGVMMPIAVVVDLTYVRASPERHTRSGIGDALSNLSAVADWELAAQHRAEPVDGLAAAFARAGAESLVGRIADLGNAPFLTTLAEALVLSGIAMSVAGSSRPCSGACHEISHAIDALFPGTGHHGEQVALGALFASWLRDDPNTARLDASLRAFGLPRVPADLGLDAEQFALAVAEGPSMRPDRYTILEHLAMDDAETRKRVDGFIEAFA